MVTPEEANRALEQKDYERSISIYIQVIASDPQSAIAYEGLADAYYHLKRYEEAKINSQKAISIDPTLPIAHIILAISTYELGENPLTSYQYAEKAYQLAPELIRAIAGFGIFSRIIGINDQSINLIKRALIVDPDNYDYHFHLFLACATIDDKRNAFTQAKDIFRLRPSFYTGYILLSSFLNLPLPRAFLVIFPAATFCGAIVLRSRVLSISMIAIITVFGIIEGVFRFRYVSKKSGAIATVIYLCFFCLFLWLTMQF
jgi:tetratricopeptide (TPR) repeat protein